MNSKGPPIRQSEINVQKSLIEKAIFCIPESPWHVSLFRAKEHIWFDVQFPELTIDSVTCLRASDGAPANCVWPLNKKRWKIGGNWRQRAIGLLEKLLASNRKQIHQCSAMCAWQLFIKFKNIRAVSLTIRELELLCSRTIHSDICTEGTLAGRLAKTSSLFVVLSERCRWRWSLYWSWDVKQIPLFWAKLCTAIRCLLMYRVRQATAQATKLNDR